jgi:heat shock protein HtpX
MAAAAGGIVYLVWGPEAVILAFAVVAISLTLMPSVPPEAILRMYRARYMRPEEFPEGYEILTTLSERCSLPVRPHLFYISHGSLNAFTLGGRQKPVIVVTAGLLHAFNLRELAAVLAHEISHIRNNDLWIMKLADSISRLTNSISYVGLFMLLLSLPLLLMGQVLFPLHVVVIFLLLPTVMALLQLALSRTREFDADLEAARLTGDPLGLASALRKLERSQGRSWEDIFFTRRRIPEPSLLRSHPATEDRVKRLLELVPEDRSIDRVPDSAIPLPVHVVPPPILRPRHWDRWA